MNFLVDIWNIITSLSFIDYILYFAVVTLIMLIVSLIYVMKEEQDEKKEEESENEIFPLQKEELDLQAIVNTIDENPEPLADMTAYEEEQEKKAIISYDELIRASQNKINYDKEEMVDDLIPVKKISLNPKESIPLNWIEQAPKLNVRTDEVNKINLFSYEKEEEFLKTLQKLNELLN